MSSTISTAKVEGMEKTTYRHKGALVSAQVVYSPTTEYGVKTEWAVQLSFQSPTGDMSDFISREIPCLSEEQAKQIVGYWETLVVPYATIKNLDTMAPTECWSTAWN